MKKILKLGRQKLWTIHREYFREKHELSYLFWECTLRCNFNCKHCGSYAGEKNSIEELTTEEIKRTFLDVSKNFNAKKITIAVTGGEPLLRKDLFEVMTYAVSLGFKWGMVSNGFLVNEEVVEKLKRAGMSTLDISIDGLEKTHDEFRNIAGSYKQAMRAVKLFQKANFLGILRVTTTVHNKNIEELEQMFDVFSDIGLCEWRLLSVDPIGRAMNNNILLNKGQLEDLLNFIKNKRNLKSKPKLTYGCAHFLGDEFEDEVRDHFFYCGAGIHVGSILHNGDIFVCPNVPRRKKLIQGNVKEDSFSEVWNSKFNFFRDKNRMKCEECEKCEYWEECLGDSLHSWDFENNKPKICFMRKNMYL